MASPTVVRRVEKGGAGRSSRSSLPVSTSSLREERKAEATPFKKSITIEAGTVHQFQGSDADVVIFDLVDGRGRDRLGLLLRDDTGLRANVAMTRARGKLIVIADRAWYSDIYLGGRNSILTDFILGEAAAIQVSEVATGPSDGNSGVKLPRTESPIEAALLNALCEHPTLASIET